MRSGFIFLACFWLCVPVLAQDKDSVVLTPVTIYGLQDAKYLAGSSVQILDSSLKANEQSRHLGEVLALQFPVYFRNYGSGMLSGISMRGTSPQHTAVLWNGINITSFSLGQADFSILPITAFDEVRVHEGAGSARFGSGAFGGTVLLNSKSTQSHSLTLTQDAGSFGRYFTSLSGQFSLGRWGSKTRFYDLNSKNDFTVLSTDQRQKHAGFRQSGILQDLEYRWSEAKVLSIHYWYHDANRNIQPTIGEANGQDTQQDRNHRLSIKYQNHNRYGLLSVYGGYVNDLIDYDGSRGSVIRWISGARHEFTLPLNTNAQFGVEWNHIVGKIPDYRGGEAKEDRYDFTAAVQKNLGSRVAVALNLRQPVVSGFNAPFLPYLGADYLVIKNGRHTVKLRGCVSKNYRIPTLNDRYWADGGNKNLLPETSHAGEAGMVYGAANLELSSTWFTQKVDQWIQWVPDKNIYRPQNIKQVIAEGIETKVSYRKQLGEWCIMPQASYQYTRSVTSEAPADQNYTLQKQLVYTPRNTASFYLQILHNRYSGNVSAQYNGVRFTDAGNSPAYALPAFGILNMGAGHFWTIDSHRIDIQISVKNLLNLNYQLYSGYAMPGRNYNVQLSYQLISNQTLR